jgi:hypothetical protein
MGDAEREVDDTRDHEAEADTAQDIERIVRAHVHPREHDEENDHPRDDLPGPC